MERIDAGSETKNTPTFFGSVTTLWNRARQSLSHTIEGPEVGDLQNIWQALVQRHPILSQVDFMQSAEVNRPTHVLPRKQGDRPIVKMPLSLKDSVRPGSILTFAEKYGYDPDAFEDERLLVTCIMFHEAGHALQFMDSLGTGDDVLAATSEHDLERKKQLNQLPIPGYTPGKLHRMGPDKFDDLMHEQGLWGNLQFYGITSFEHLVQVQSAHYRELPMEKDADEFAVQSLSYFGYLKPSRSTNSDGVGRIAA